MLDIGGPEFLVIAIVALVVLGPDRLPEVMRKAGQFYRQARETLSQYTTEAQRMFEEGLREVEDVGTTVSNAWQDATSDAAANAPPPPLRQLPPPLLAPDTAAAAGPWTLPAFYRDSRADLEPQFRSYPESPFSLPRARAAADDWLDDLNVGGPSLMGPPPEIEMAEPALPPASLAPDAPREPPREPSPAPSIALALAPEPPLELGAADEGRLFEPQPETSVAGRNGAVHAAGDGAQTDPGAVRQETLIALYRTGDLTLEKAAEFLGITQPEFRALLKRK